MAGSLNKVIELYASGKSIPDVSALTGIPRSTVRKRLADAGALRSRTEGIRAAREKLGSGTRGTKRTFSNAHKAALTAARNARPVAGVSVKPNGYVEHTVGEHKGRSVHVVLMEQRIGRKLRPDEVVHHIDGDRSNNAINNLALMTRAAHTRLHRREERLCGKAA